MTSTRVSRKTALIRPLKAEPGETAPVIAADHEAMLESEDPVLLANKRLCYDMYRIILQAGHADRVSEFISPTYIQHNPNVIDGPDALAAYVRSTRPERDIKPKIDLPLISISAERDMVTFAFVRPETDASGKTYHTTWFDMFRIEDGRIAEHWDPALRSAEMLRVDPNEKRLEI